mmetsp:Transcript_16082/g.32456  ORF Transcript_16082/g.32456 Transcript_16082/m.32456 type:complete len:86 (+) Transcript_16082:2665-2922(+)
MGDIEGLVALAAQKFLADIANDAIGHCKLRQVAGGRGRGAKEGRMVLMPDDFEKALREYGVALRKPPYYANSAESTPAAPSSSPP